MKPKKTTRIQTKTISAKSKTMKPIKTTRIQAKAVSVKSKAMKLIGTTRAQARDVSIKSVNPKLIPFLNDKGEIVYITEATLNQILAKQRKGLEKLRGIWEDKDDSFFDVSGK